MRKKKMEERVDWKKLKKRNVKGKYVSEIENNINNSNRLIGRRIWNTKIMRRECGRTVVRGS